jgi:hypothetical protein
MRLLTLSRYDPEYAKAYREKQRTKRDAERAAGKIVAPPAPKAKPPMREANLPVAQAAVNLDRGPELPPACACPAVTEPTQFPDGRTQQAPHAVTVPWTRDNRDALKEYTSLTGYIDIQTMLRTGKVPSYRGRESLEHTVEEIHDSMRPLVEATTVYRGVNLKQFASISEVTQLPSLVGKIIHDKGFTSTSKELIGKYVPDEDDVLLTLHVPSGYPVADLSQTSEWKSEKELLLTSGSSFRVVGAIPPSDTLPRWQVIVDVIP